MRGLFAGLCCLVPALVESLSIASIPSVELWLDLRESLLDPAYTLRELEANVPGPRSVPLVAGLVVWQCEAGLETYASLGDAAEACGLPIIAVDVGDAELALQLFEGGAPMVAASRGVKAPSAIQPPYDANAAVAALKPGSCLVVDSRPNRFLDETLPLVELLAAAAGSSARLLIACERSNLAACCQALILGDAVGSTSLLGGGAAADAAAAGLGLVLRPEPRLWTEALDFQ
ncbi:hypothetical protein M885DRAFT_516395 [Pelagophyceae sp. CCMP2097]|nr:hypothetical protein M885DRAFT_516395 [Pelagophyceae sp. CCMP2097]